MDICTCYLEPTADGRAHHYLDALTGDVVHQPGLNLAAPCLLHPDGKPELPVTPPDEAVSPSVETPVSSETEPVQAETPAPVEDEKSKEGPTHILDDGTLVEEKVKPNGKSLWYLWKDGKRGLMTSVKDRDPQPIN